MNLDKKQRRKASLFVPFTVQEWERVKRYYMSEDVMELETAYEIISMWHGRTGEKTPVIISISELILQAILLDKRPKQTMENIHKAHIFASTITRFVNYVNEVCQSGNKLQSISYAVREIGIPPWVVNVRHQATHGEMPPMEMLRKTIEYAHKWLWTYYWVNPFNVAIRSLSRDVVEKKLVSEQLKTTIKIYDCLDAFRLWRSNNREAELPPKSKKIKANVVSNEGKTPLTDWRTCMEELLEQTPGEFISALVECCLGQGKILPELDKTSAAINEVPLGRKFISTVVPAEQMVFYSPVMELLNEHGLFSLLLIELTKMIVDSGTPLRMRARLSGWADQLLTALLIRPMNISDADWHTVLLAMVYAPQFYNQNNFDSLFEHMEGKLPEKTIISLQELLEMVSDVGGVHPGSSAYEMKNPVNGNDINNSGEDVEIMFEGAFSSTTPMDDLDLRSSSPILTLSELKYNLSKRDEPLVPKYCSEEDWGVANPSELGPLGLTSQQTSDTLDLELRPPPNIPMD